MKQATLSLDLDNTWAYLKVRGDSKWESYPSHFSYFIPFVLDFLKSQNLYITFFIVGQDAEFKENHALLKTIAQAGHEVANHSFYHEPSMAAKDFQAIFNELKRADDAIFKATGQKPVGFRGPGFCQSDALRSAIKQMGYFYDSSLLPTSLGPVAKLYMTLFSRGSVVKEKEQLFGKSSNALLPNKPHYLDGLLEIPVTTMPYLRFPFHMTYLLWLYRFSETVAWNYFKGALKLCKSEGLSPTFLLHPTDFLSVKEVPELSFFPAMGIDARKKREFVARVLQELGQSYEIAPLSVFASNFTGCNA